MKLAVFLPNWIGDAAMATPALRAIRKRFASAQMIGVMRPYVTDVLAGTPWLDEVLLFDPRSPQRRQRSWAVARQLRPRSLDLAILFTNSLRPALIAWAAGARQRIGFVRNGRGWLLTDRLYHRRQGRRYLPSPVLDDYLRLAYAAGCEPEPPRLELATLPADELAADSAWQRLGLGGQRVVAFNSGGAYGAAKLWPTEYFAALARRVAGELDHSVLVICGPSERAIARQIVHQAGHQRVVSLAVEPPSVGLTKACIRRSTLLVTTDSGPRHFAAAFGVPVITLFGPTHTAWSENYYARAVHLQRDVPCGPCQQRVCPLGHHRCMTELRVDEVFAAVVQQLELAGADRAA